MTDTTTTPRSEPLSPDALADLVDRHLAAYGEPDGPRRRAAIAALWSKDGRLVDPPVDGQGHEGIDTVASAVQSQFPGHTFRRTSGVDAHREFARYAWELAAPDGTVALQGLDVVRIAGDGRLAGVVGFLGDLPA